MEMEVLETMITMMVRYIPENVGGTKGSRTNTETTTSRERC